MANNKQTRDRVAAIASRLLRTSSDPDVLRVAASVVAQSDPRPDPPESRDSRRKAPRRRPRAKFKAGKDLVTEPGEGGGTE